MDTEDKFKFAVSASHNKMLSFDFFKKNYVVPVGLTTTTTQAPVTNSTEENNNDIENQEINQFGSQNYGAGGEELEEVQQNQPEDEF